MAKILNLVKVSIFYFFLTDLILMVSSPTKIPCAECQLAYVERQ